MDTILHVSTWQRPGRLCTTDSAQGGSVGLCAKEIGSLPPKKDTAMEAFLLALNQFIALPTPEVLAPLEQAHVPV